MDKLVEFIDKIDKIRGLLEYPSSVRQILGEEYLSDDKRLDVLQLLSELREDANLMLEEDDYVWATESWGEV